MIPTGDMVGWVTYDIESNPVQLQWDEKVVYYACCIMRGHSVLGHNTHLIIGLAIGVTEFWVCALFGTLDCLCLRVEIYLSSFSIFFFQEKIEESLHCKEWGFLQNDLVLDFSDWFRRRPSEALGDKRVSAGLEQIKHKPAKWGTNLLKP